ncbi:alpha/beta hydrolase family protein, partial [Undibacterium sp.]|uniref:alpha/beta hydrolase family protein n=1 Tax=Undibacterium sp. TaxID=1914977 RepID=UPI0037504C0C
TSSTFAPFGQRGSVMHMDMSPNGKRVAYLSAGPGRETIAYVAEIGSDQAPQIALVSRGDVGDLRWCKFVSNQRLICRFSGVTDLAGTLAGYSRLAAVDIDGKNIQMLGQNASSYDARARQFDGDILDWMSGENDAVLMSREYVPEINRQSRIARNADGLGVDLLDTRTLEVTKIEGAMKSADGFFTDGRGQVRMKEYQPREGSSNHLSAKIVYHYRLKNTREWLPFSTWEDGVGMRPIEVDAESNSAYVLKKLNDHLALYRVKLDGSMAIELVYKNDKVDVDGVVKIRRNSRAIGVTFAEEGQHIEYFDPKYAKLVASLSEALPNFSMIDVLCSSLDEKTLLIRAGSDSDAGRYFAFDAVKMNLHELALTRPSLENFILSSVKPMTYRAKDGTEIPAYLTLPPGKESARGLPAIVMPHGGPSARDVWGFDWLAQAFAYHGYAVIQPNYRGSAGYGDKWMLQNGFKSWRTSVGDVVDAGLWLVNEGIADPNSIAIVGWSYGGYAALQSDVVAPKLFKAVVAIAPVTDLQLLKQAARDFTNSNLVDEFVGEGAHLIEGSPLQNARKISAPVLMFHGDLDINVGVQQSQKMNEKLRDLDKKSELVVFKGLAHGLEDSKIRTEMLEKIDAFLKSNSARR